MNYLEEENIQVLGFFGICKISFKIIFTNFKMYIKLSLTFLLIPLLCTVLARNAIYKLLPHKLDYPDTNTPHEEQGNKGPLVLVQLANLMFLVICYLLSSSTIVYAIACIYTGKDITFKKVVNVIPKVWKRVGVTYLKTFGITSLFFLVFVLTTSSSALILISLDEQLSGILVLLITSVIYFVGFVYIGVTWQLATVISVTEDAYGIQAIMRSEELLRGKMVTAVATFFSLSPCILGLMYTDASPWFDRRREIISLIWISFIMSYLIVLQTVFYFACKSYHGENIDQNSFLDHLDASGSYIPLKTTEAIQPEK